MTAPRKRAPGGGRRPLSAAPDDPTERQDVTMPASYWAKARALGDGNASAGIRVALEAASSLHEQTRYARSKGKGICQGCRSEVDLGIAFCQPCCEAEIIFDLDYRQFGIDDPLESMRLQTELCNLREALDCGNVQLAAIAGITFGNTLAYTCSLSLDQKSDPPGPAPQKANKKSRKKR